VTVHLRRPWSRTACVLLLLVVLGVAGAAVAERASAHPLSTTAVLLDVGATQVTGRVQLPIDRLGIALEDPTLTPEAAMEPAELTLLRSYVALHTAATGPDGSAWQVEVDGGHVETIDAVDHLVFALALHPPDGQVEDFMFSYDAIVEHLLSHQVFVSVRQAGGTDYTTAGVIDWQQHDLSIRASDAGDTGTTDLGFLASVHVGVEHISQGADHLLFLVMLLLPAPLLARGSRWVRRDDLRRAGWRVLHVVTAFAIGHSLTLALAALGYISVNSRVVESLIAVSILASAVHALKPLVPGGEAMIGAGFGLVHGLAFAVVISELGLDRGSLVVDLLGFNLGIELTQLLVVALLMPSLMVLSRTRVYPVVRTVLALVGVVLAAAWLAERTTLIATNPLSGAADLLTTQPVAIAGGLAVGAVVTWAVPRLRADADLTDDAAPHPLEEEPVITGL
jgi:hypothetical protein